MSHSKQMVYTSRRTEPLASRVVLKRMIPRELVHNFHRETLQQEARFLRLESFLEISEFLNSKEFVGLVGGGCVRVPVWYVFVMSLRRHGVDPQGIRKFFRWFASQSMERRAISFIGAMTDEWSPHEEVFLINGDEELPMVELVLPEDIKEGDTSVVEVQTQTLGFGILYRINTVGEKVSFTVY